MARDGSTHSYTETNRDNEYGQIDGQALTYDAAGNLSVDEDGRHYFYDEQNRLTQVKAAGGAVLASYTYDALGRRIATNWMRAGQILYYHDGASVIEERGMNDVRVRLHINGSQYIDERVATYRRHGPVHLLPAGQQLLGCGVGNPRLAKGDFAGSRPSTLLYCCRRTAGRPSRPVIEQKL